MRFVIQSSQVERKFNMLPLNRKNVFQILDLGNGHSELFESEELQEFLNVSKELVATGVEFYPGKMLPPIKENVILLNNPLDLLINYYNRAYAGYNFSRPQLDSSLSNVNYVAVTGKVASHNMADCALEQNTLDLYYLKDISKAPIFWHVL